MFFLKKCSSGQIRLATDALGQAYMCTIISVIFDCRLSTFIAYWKIANFCKKKLLLVIMAEHYSLVYIYKFETIKEGLHRIQILCRRHPF